MFRVSWQRCGKRHWGWRSAIGVVSLLVSCPLWADFSRLAQLQDKGFAISAEARLLNGDANAAPLASIEPNRQLSPASVTKAYLAAAALQRYGPQHRFTSQLISPGNVTNGVLSGDLIFEGGGDPG